MTTPNQEYREDLREHGEGRDREVPLLSSERNRTRGSVCRANMLERIRALGYDEGAGDREAVRRRRAA